MSFTLTRLPQEIQVAFSTTADPLPRSGAPGYQPRLPLLTGRFIDSVDAENQPTVQLIGAENVEITIFKKSNFVRHPAA